MPIPFPGIALLKIDDVTTRPLLLHVQRGDGGRGDPMQSATGLGRSRFRVNTPLRLATATLALGITTVSVAVLPNRIAEASTQTTTITTPGETAYLVPANATSLQVTVVGAAGSTVFSGGAPVGAPGSGASVMATLTPPGPTTLYVEVGNSSGGGGGGRSTYAADGGGESAIQTCSVSNLSCTYSGVPGPDPRIVVAGGGGGGGEDNQQLSNFGGNGGNAGASAAVTGPGAGGSGTDHGDGHTGVSVGLANGTASAVAGSGSANCSGGAGGVGTPGSGGIGENALAGASANGGGGGGGWVGGSGGGAGDCRFGGNVGGAGGGGGGGASFVESTATGISITTAGSAPPEVVITATIVVPQTITINSPAPSGAVVGGPTYTVTATGGGSGNPVTFTIDSSSTSGCMVVGAVVSFPAPTGTCVIDADQAGDADYFAAPTAQQSFLVAQNTQVIIFTSSAPSGAFAGGSYTVTATGGASGNPVTFTVDPSATSVCSILGSIVSLIGGGTCVIDANQAGNASYLPAPRAQQSFTVSIPGPPPPSKCKFVSAASDRVQAASSIRFLVMTNACYPWPSITASGMPAWLTLTDGHDRFAWITASSAVAGRYAFTLTATNTLGAITQKFRLVVSKAPKPGH